MTFDMHFTHVEYIFFVLGFEVQNFLLEIPKLTIDKSTLLCQLFIYLLFIYFQKMRFNNFKLNFLELQQLRNKYAKNTLYCVFVMVTQLSEQYIVFHKLRVSSSTNLTNVNNFIYLFSCFFFFFTQTFHKLFCAKHQLQRYGPQIMQIPQRIQGFTNA